MSRSVGRACRIAIDVGGILTTGRVGSNVDFSRLNYAAIAVYLLYWMKVLENFRTSSGPRKERRLEAIWAVIPELLSLRIRDLVAGISAAVTLKSRSPRASQIGSASGSEAISPQIDALTSCSWAARITCSQT